MREIRFTISPEGKKAFRFWRHTLDALKRNLPSRYLYRDTRTHARRDPARMLHSAGLNVSRLYSDPRVFFFFFFHASARERRRSFPCRPFFAADGNDASRTGPNPERVSSLFLSFFHGNGFIIIIIRLFLNVNTDDKSMGQLIKICLDSTGILIILL